MTISLIAALSATAQNADYMKMLESATRAPSGHNTQPWKFKLADNAIDVYPDLDDSLPVVDGGHRELYISLGCAVENLCLTANEIGYSAETNILQNDSGLYYIHIELTKTTTILDPLATQIERRQSNRSVYQSRIITSDTLQMLKSILPQNEIFCYFYANGEDTYQTLTDFVFCGNDIQMRDKAFKTELLDWIRFNKKQAVETKNGLMYSVMGSPSIPKWLGKPVVGSFLTPNAQNKSGKKKIASSSHFVLFTVKQNTPEVWILTGCALEQFLLKATELKIATAFLNQACEVNELSEELRKTLLINNEYPMLLLRIGYAAPMPYSLRKPINAVLIEQ
jgi:nitroreductase